MSFIIVMDTDITVIVIHNYNGGIPVGLYVHGETNFLSTLEVLLLASSINETFNLRIYYVCADNYFQNISEILLFTGQFLKDNYIGKCHI